MLAEWIFSFSDVISEMCVGWNVRRMISVCCYGHYFHMGWKCRDAINFNIYIFLNILFAFFLYSTVFFCISFSIPFIHWNTDMIVDWLHKLGFSMYISDCKRWMCNGEILNKATSHDFEKVTKILFSCSILKISLIWSCCFSFIKVSQFHLIFFNHLNQFIGAITIRTLKYNLLFF